MESRIILQSRFLFACGLALLLPLFSAQAQSTPPPLGSQKEFWVWDLNVMPPAFRKANATLRAVGSRSYIYVEEKFWPEAISPALVEKMLARFETESAPGAVQPGTGMIPLEEKLFAPLPNKIHPDERVTVLFADLGKYKNYSFDGFFNAFDQMKEEIAWKDFEQHSNESNIIYINGPRQSEEYTLGVISHELQHLLAYHAVTGSEPFQQDLWLSETIAEGAMLLNGYYTDQGHVNRYVEESSKHPLISHNYVQYGPQLLFSSFLIDVLGRNGGLGDLTRSGIRGQDAVEALYQNRTNAPISFDAIFSNFINYVFQASNSRERLPNTWKHNTNTGILVPKIKSSAVIQSLPATFVNTLLPYSFATYELANELPENSLVKVERLDTPNSAGGDCAANATTLWKPLSPKILAVYAIGCEHKEKSDQIRYRLSIFGKPSIFLPTPFRLAF